MALGGDSTVKIRLYVALCGAVASINDPDLTGTVNREQAPATPPRRRGPGDRPSRLTTS